MPRLVLLLALAALAGPRIAVAQAACEGLLLEVLSAGECRQRTREVPERRPTEDRALEIANHAAAQPQMVVGGVWLSIPERDSSDGNAPIAAVSSEMFGATPWGVLDAGSPMLPMPPPVDVDRAEVTLAMGYGWVGGGLDAAHANATAAMATGPPTVK